MIRFHYKFFPVILMVVNHWHPHGLLLAINTCLGLWMKGRVRQAQEEATVSLGELVTVCAQVTNCFSKHAYGRISPNCISVHTYLNMRTNVGRCARQLTMVSFLCVCLFVSIAHLSAEVANWSDEWRIRKLVGSCPLGNLLVMANRKWSRSGR